MKQIKVKNPTLGSNTSLLVIIIYEDIYKNTMIKHENYEGLVLHHVEISKMFLFNKV